MTSTRPSLLQPMYDHARLMEERETTAAGQAPTFIPDPLERRTLLKVLASVLRALAGRWKR